MDSSGPAVELAESNAKLNDLSGVASFVKDDISSFMREAVSAGRQWDVVVLDPPKLAPNRESLDKAKTK